MRQKIEIVMNGKYRRYMAHRIDQASIMTISKLDEKSKAIDKKNELVLNKEFKSLMLRGHSQLSDYAEQIDSLFSETAAPSAVRWPLLESWLLYKPEVEPMGVLIWHHQALIAAGLLALEHRKGFCKITKIGVEGEPYWLSARDPFSGALLGEGLVKALQSIKKPWFLHLTDLPGTDPVINAINARLELSQISTFSYSPQLWFDRECGLNRYLSLNTRSAVAKAKNRIKRDGLALDMRWSSDVSDIENAMDEIVQVHRDRNRLKHGRAILDDPREAAFFRETVLTQARAERIRLLTLRLNSSLAAFAIAVLDRDMLWIYANLVSPSWLRYSAGTILNAEVVRAAYGDSSIKGVNWGAGLQRYKMSGDVKLVPLVKLMGWSSRPTRLAWLGREKIRQGRSKIRQILASAGHFIGINRHKKNTENGQASHYALCMFSGQYMVEIGNSILSLDSVLSFL
jgi:hypothetical protein